MYQIVYKDTKRKPLWLVSASYTMGSGSDCDIYISDAGLAEEHARFEIADDTVTLVKLANDAVISVNGETISDSASLKHGDTFSISGIEGELLEPKATRAQMNAAPDAPAVWSLKATSSALAGKILGIKSDTTFGRSDECDVTLSVSHLSRKHAKCFLQNEHLFIKDLGSSNGTYVNGVKIQTTTKLKPGDEIRFDTLKFVVDGPRGAAGAEMTELRDENKTVMRPIIRNTPKPAANPSAQPQQRATRAQPKASKPVVIQSAKEEVKRSAVREKEPGTNNAVVIVSLVLLATACAAAAWYFFS